jgi:hypothetical protein
VICAQCQANNDADAAFCGNCGNRLTGQPIASDPPATPGSSAVNMPGTSGANMPGSAPSHAVDATGHTTAFSLDIRRLSQVERVVGGASLVVLISLFLPWFGFGVDGESFSISGVTAHGYLYLALILTLAIVAYLVLRSGWDQVPVTLPIAHGPLLLIGTGLQFLLVLVAFLDKPLGLLNWEIGAYLGLIAALVAAGPVVVPAIRSFNDSRRR